MTRALLATAGACAAVALAASCGSGSGEEEAVRDALGDLRRSYVAEDYAAVCGHLSRAARREIGELGHQRPTDCAHDLALNLSAAVLDSRDRVEPEIKAIAIDGDRATVTARLGGTTPSTIHLVREDGAWKLGQLYGTTGPPAPDLR